MSDNIDLADPLSKNSRLRHSEGGSDEGKGDKADATEKHVTTSQYAKPPFSIHACVARDPWTHGAALSRWEHVYEQVRPGPFSGRVNAAWLGPIQIVHECVDHAVNYRGTCWRGSRVFVSYREGCSDIHYDGRPVTASTVLTHRWNGVRRVSCRDHMERVIVAIDEQFMAEYLAPLSWPLVTRPDPICCTSEPEAFRAFQQAVLSILQELDQSRPTLHDEGLCARLQHLALDSIVAVLSSGRGAFHRLPAPSTRAYVVGQAIDYMEAHLADRISVRDICAAIRVCPRTLSYAFSRVLGASPKSYLQATRLNGAFRDLAGAQTRVSIESVAARWGFFHMGRFAKYYRGAFGERPSETYRARALPRRPDRAPLTVRKRQIQLGQSLTGPGNAYRLTGFAD